MHRRTKNGIIFSLRKKDERGTLLTGAGFNVYYADDNSLCREMNAHLDKKGVYATDIDDKGDTLEHPEIPVDDRQFHATLNADGTKTLELIVREDKVPDNYGKVKDFRVKAVSRYNDRKQPVGNRKPLRHLLRQQDGNNSKWRNL